jgi:hypothetical protein
MDNARSRYIVQYSTRNLSSKDIVRFFYELKGRGNNPGILIDTHSVFLTKSLLEVPNNSLPTIKYFLKKWSCDYKIIKQVPRPQATHRLFIFSSHKLKGSNRVKFLYELKGRGKKAGILKQTNSKYLARSIILVSMKDYFEILKFLRKWKCNFKIKEVQLNAK